MPDVGMEVSPPVDTPVSRLRHLVEGRACTPFGVGRRLGTGNTPWRLVGQPAGAGGWGRDTKAMTERSPLCGISSAEAFANLAANLSAMRCPTSHGNAVPVETADGELVAWLCPSCDQQLPVAWATVSKPAPALPPFVPYPRPTGRSGM